MQLLLIAGLSLFFLLASSSACTCPKRSLDEELKVTQAIFTGRCISATYHPKLGANEYVFEVERSWKEGLAERVSVHSMIWGSACGFIFTPGYRYTVWIRADQPMWTGLCTRTDEADSEKSKKDLETLGSPLIQHVAPK